MWSAQNRTNDTNEWSEHNKTNDTNEWSVQNKTNDTNKWYSRLYRNIKMSMRIIISF